MVGKKKERKKDEEELSFYLLTDFVQINSFYRSCSSKQ